VEKTYLTINAPNIITIAIMVLLGQLALRVAMSAMKPKASAPANG